MASIDTLQMCGVESVLLRFQEEYHGTGSKPTNQVRTLLYMLDWYGSHRRAPARGAADGM